MPEDGFNDAQSKADEGPCLPQQLKLFTDEVEVDRTRASLGETKFGRAWSEGSQLDLTAAMQCGLDWMLLLNDRSERTPEVQLCK